MKIYLSLQMKRLFQLFHKYFIGEAQSHVVVVSEIGQNLCS